MKYGGMNKIKTERVIYGLSFFLPVILGLIILGLYNISGLGPVGMENDVNIEYVEFLSYYRRTLLDGGDFLYSFHKGIGGEMVAFFAYYFASPFNLLVLLFRQENMPLAILTIVLAKIGCSGLTMNYFLNKVFYKKWYSLAFSMGYALMGYSVAYFYNYMWLDGVIMLPLVIMGLHRMTANKRISLWYILPLFGAIIFNYYIGWMVCIFSGIYMLYLLIALDMPFMEKVKAGIRFLFSSFIAAGLSCFLLVPTLRSIVSSAKNTAGLRMDFNRNFGIFEILPRFLSGAGINKDAGLPNILCGSLMFLLLIGYFIIRKKIRLREKIGAAVVFIILFLSMWLQFLNLVWHGFNYNIGYPYRYSFVVSFFVLTLAYKSFYLMEAVFWQRYRLKKILVASFVIIHLADLTLYSFYHLNTGVITAGEYREKVQENQRAVDSIKEADPSVYRMEKLYLRTFNDACQNGYYGLNHYSSSVALEPIYFLEKLGLTRKESEYIIQYRNGVTTFADSLLGVKYLLAKDAEVNTKYPHVMDSGDIRVYQNPYALPLAVACSEDIMQVYASNDYANGLLMQSRFADAMVAAGVDIYQEAPYRAEYDNLDIEQESPLKVSKKDGERDGIIHYRVAIEQEDELYATVFSWKKGGELYVNGVPQPDFLLEEYASTRLGKFRPGETVDVALHVTRDEIKLEHVYFYYEKKDELDRWRRELLPYEADITGMTNSVIEGSFTADEEHSRLLLSIPYDRRWRLKVDGAGCPVDRTFEGLISASVTPGKHTFRMKYVPDGLKTGIGISALSALLLAAVLLGRFLGGKGAAVKGNTVQQSIETG